MCELRALQTCCCSSGKATTSNDVDVHKLMSKCTKYASEPNALFAKSEICIVSSTRKHFFHVTTKGTRKPVQPDCTHTPDVVLVGWWSRLLYLPLPDNTSFFPAPQQRRRSREDPCRQPQRHKRPIQTQWHRPRPTATDHDHRHSQSRTMPPCHFVTVFCLPLAPSPLENRVPPKLPVYKLH